MPKRLTKEIFIKRAREVHGNKYDYSKAEYVNNSTKVCIICPEHGEFWQTPGNHLHKTNHRGCPKCAHSEIMTNTEFIKRAREVHGDKYDYSKTNYVGYKEKVYIICPIHGGFWQLAGNHINKAIHRGCPKCNGGISITTEEFIQKSRKVHGDNYDYSKVEYINANTKVCIVCPKHSEFWQKPSSHLNGSGCPKCWKERKPVTLLSSTEEFIQKARKIHGEKYDYSKVIYECSSKKVRIICPKHGKFWQTPNKHLSGRGCPKCGKLTILRKRTMSITEFIRRAREIHRDKYNYSKVDMLNRDEKGRVCIICPIHGEFWQTPNNHLSGKGCELCVRPMHDTETFIERAKNIHGDKYDYSKVIYLNTQTRVNIVCPEHGEFLQLPQNHLKGYGCPKCNRSHLEEEINLFLKEKNIIFEEQKSFDWLISDITSYKLKLDFYLSEYNIAIECQGGQHFKEVEFFNDSLAEISRRDEIKRKLCEENGVKLLYYSNIGFDYPYLVYEDKNELLKEIIK